MDMGITITMEGIGETEAVEMTKKEVQKEEKVLAQVRLLEDDHHPLPLHQEETSRSLLPLRVLITQRAEVIAQNQTIQITPINQINLNQNQNRSQSRNQSQKTQRVEALTLNKMKV